MPLSEPAAAEPPLKAPGLQRVLSEEFCHVPMRVDSFGDVVPIGATPPDSDAEA